MAGPAVIKTDAEMLLALKSHFSSPEYVLLPQVRNGAGFSATRTADAIAMSVWPSRGLSLFGIEIKVSRSDWMRELRNPKKAEEIAQFVDHWYLAVGSEDIVQDAELPPTWGLLVPGKKPNTLRIKTPAPKLEAKPMSRTFLACLLKKTVEVVVPLGEVEAEIKRRVAAQTAVFEETTRMQLERELDRDSLKQKVFEYEEAHRAFTEATGIPMTRAHLSNLKAYAKAFRLLQWSGIQDWVWHTIHQLEETTKSLKDLRSAIPAEEKPKENAA